MESIKAFFAKDWVKIIVGGVLAIATGLVMTLVKDTSQQVTYIAIIGVIGSFFGITSGGTSNLRSNASNDQVAVLEQKNILPTPPAK